MQTHKFLSLYRQILRLHKQKLPPTQIRDSNAIIKNMFYQQSSMQAAIAQAKKYIDRLQEFSQHQEGSVIQLNTPEYWNGYYQHIYNQYKKQITPMHVYLQQQFREWYCDASVFDSFIPKRGTGKSVLILGNGLSELPFLLQRRSYQVTATDVSLIATQIMQQCALEFDNEKRKKKWKTPLQPVTFVTCDARQLKKELHCSKGFDYVLDKGMYGIVNL